MLTLPPHVVAVVPTFRPGVSVRGNVLALAEQCTRVIVVDDGSGAGAEAALDALEESGVDVVRLEENGGIARALNEGVRRALADPATSHVLTVDQDSRICAGFVAHAVQVAAAGRRSEHLGLVVPAVVAGRPVVMAGSTELGPSPVEPIQSGMLITRAALEKVGPFREEFFIDHVDSDFFLRARRAGLLTVACPRCAIEHELGSHRTSLPGRAGFAYHPPLRRYYMTRNRLFLLREHGRDDRAWRRRIVRAEIMGLGTTLLFGRDRKGQLRAVLAGVTAYRRSELGPAPERVRRRLETR